MAGSVNTAQGKRQAQLAEHVDALRAEHQRLARHAAALRELKARDAMVISL